MLHSSLLNSVFSSITVTIFSKSAIFISAPKAAKTAVPRDDSGQPQTPEKSKSSSVSSPGDENDPGGGADDKLDGEESDTDIGSDIEDVEDDTEVIVVIYYPNTFIVKSYFV